MDNLFGSSFKIQAAYPKIIETKRLIPEKQPSSDLISVEFFILLKDTREKIGTVVMVYDGEIWYKVDKPFNKKGYATEAVSKLIDISEGNSFYLSIKSTNTPSIKVAKKLGFRFQKIINVNSLIFVKEK